MSNTAERITYRVDEFARLLGVSKSTIWNRVNDGSLKTVKFGGATLIPAAELDRILSTAA